MTRFVLSNYAVFVGLDTDDALRHASDVGLTLNLYADPTGDGAEDVSVEDAIEAAQVDPDLVYLTGRDEQANVTVADLIRLDDEGFDPPTVVDAHTGWVVSYPTDDYDGEWGVTRAAGDDGWTLINARDGYMDETHVGLDLQDALDECAVRNAD